MPAFVFDVIAPVLGALIYLSWREWRAEGRADEQGEVLPHTGSAPDDMPVVGSSSTADERR